MKVTESPAKEVNVQQACAALALPWASLYRWQDREEDDREEQRSVPPMPLSGEEEKAVLEIILHTDRFVDQAPLESYNTLLDEGNYLVLREDHVLLSLRDHRRLQPVRGGMNGGPPGTVLPGAETD